jgi:hypothetical protein
MKYLEMKDYRFDIGARLIDRRGSDYQEIALLNIPGNTPHKV